MTQKELIEKVRCGERIHTEFSIHEKEQKPCKHNMHMWRVIVCDDSEWDVVECWRCGMQKISRCNFDEDYS